MSVYYYENGWKPYASAKVIGSGKFSYVARNGAKKVTQGVPVSYENLAVKVPRLNKNVVYFNRVGTVGAKIFAMDADQKVSPGITPEPSPIVTPRPSPSPSPEPVPPVAKKEFPWVTVAIIGVLTYLVLS
jgi:hypothetical protein